MNWWVDFNYICKDVTLQHAEKVTAGLKLPNLSQKGLVCTISHELVGSFQPDLHGYNIRT